MLDWIKSHLLLAERHKDLYDILIKVTGLAFTAIGAIVVGIKYFKDRKEARHQIELNLRRKAYFDLFSTIPAQQFEIGKLMGHAREAPVVVPKWFKAMNRLHLLAHSEGLMCVIDRNTIYHRGFIELTMLKKVALDLDGEARAALGTDPDDLQKRRRAAWEAVWKRTFSLLRELGDNYRKLITIARREIDLDEAHSEIIAALELDLDLGLKVLAGIASEQRRLQGFPQRTEGS